MSTLDNLLRGLVKQSPSDRVTELAGHPVAKVQSILYAVLHDQTWYYRFHTIVNVDQDQALTETWMFLFHSHQLCPKCGDSWWLQVRPPVCPYMRTQVEAKRTFLGFHLTHTAWAGEGGLSIGNR